MKHLMTLAALFVSSLAMAQMPYNPDADNDQFIGPIDLLAFLPLFGEDWNPDSLVIYGLSELVEPEFCNWPGNSNDCDAQDWRLVPDDADIIYWDLGNSGIDYKLWLPEVPKQLVVYGTSMNANVVMNGYHYDQNQIWTGSGIPTFTNMENSARATLLIPFAEKYWILSN